MQIVRRSSRLPYADLFILFVLLLAGLKFTFGIEHVLDISLYDESIYLRSGTALLQKGFPPAAFAPLYALWYHALSLAQPDAVHLYYLNYVLTTILPPLALYALLRLNRVTMVLSAFVVGFFLITQANFVTWPRPTHPALLIVLLAGVAASLVRRPAALAWMAVGALLASFFRPEYFLAVLFLLGFQGIWLILHRKDEKVRRAVVPLAVSLLLTIALVATFGPPAFDKGGGERHFYAFSQHFAINWGEWNHVAEGGSFQPSTNFEEITARYFGDAKTVFAALRHNPAMFAKHIFTNLRRGLARFPGAFSHHENLVLPVGEKYNNLEARLALILFVIALGATYRLWLPRLRLNLHRHWLLLTCFGLICVPPLLACVEIFPHDHYLLLPGVLLIAGVMIALYSHETEPAKLKPWVVLALGLVLLAVTPGISRRPTVDRPIVATIRNIQSLGITQPIIELDAEGGYHNYQGFNYGQVTEYSKHVPFNEFLPEENIGMIVLTKKLCNDSHFLNDSSWQTFLAQYQNFGFQKRAIPGTGNTLLIRNDLLPDGALPDNR